MAVDYLRSCYTATYKFFKDSDDVTQVTWYFVDDVPPLPINRDFGSRQWDAYEGIWEPGLGEQLYPPPVYAHGNRVGDAVPNHFCGTEDQWVNGCLRADALGPGDLDAAGTPLCCGRATWLLGSKLRLTATFWARSFARPELSGLLGLSASTRATARLPAAFPSLATLSAAFAAGHQWPGRLSGVLGLSASTRATARLPARLPALATLSATFHTGYYRTPDHEGYLTLSARFAAGRAWAGDCEGYLTLSAAFAATSGVAMSQSGKLGMTASMAAFSVVTPAGGCGSLPSTLHCRTSGGTLGAAVMNGLNVTMTYNSGFGNWMGTAVVSGQTETFTLLCMAGTWHMAILGVTWGGTGTASGPSGASPNLTSTVLANTGFTGQLLATITRT